MACLYCYCSGHCWNLFYSLGIFKIYLMTPLPKWIDDSPDPRDLREALSIAWEALEKVCDYNIMSDPYSRKTSKIMEAAMRRIEELGK